LKTLMKVGWLLRLLHSDYLTPERTKRFFRFSISLSLFIGGILILQPSAWIGAAFVAAFVIWCLAIFLLSINPKKAVDFSRLAPVKLPDWPPAKTYRGIARRGDASVRAFDSDLSVLGAALVVRNGHGVLVRALRSSSFALLINNARPILVTGVCEIEGGGIWAPVAFNRLERALPGRWFRDAAAFESLLVDGALIEIYGQLTREPVAAGYRDEERLVLRGIPGHPVRVRLLTT
jgi:hypothetical protein